MVWSRRLAVLGIVGLLSVPSCRSGDGTQQASLPDRARRVAGGCGQTALYRGASEPWTRSAAAPTGLVQATGRAGRVAAFLFGYPLRAGHPTDPANKILWVVREPRDGADLVVTAHPLSSSTPTVTVREPANSEPGEIYPSIVDVPTPGCWAFTLRWHGNVDHLELPYRAPAVSPSTTPPPTSAPVPQPGSVAPVIVNQARTSPTGGWVLTDRSVLRTDDAGRSWRTTELADVAAGGHRPESFFATPSAAWVATVRPASGAAVVTRVDRDASTTVAALPDPVPGDARLTLSILGRDRGFAAVDRASHGADLYRTGDGGRSWTVVARDQPFDGPIHFVTAATGWAFGSAVWRTDDGGRTWRRQHPPAPFTTALPGRFTTLSMFGARGVLAVEVPTGMMGYLIFDITHDGGRSWQPRESPENSRYTNTGPPRILAATDADHWYLLIADRVWVTADAGRHWTVRSRHALDGAFLTASFADRIHGWASATPTGCETADVRVGCTLLTTDDGGRSWRPLPLPAAPAERAGAP